MLYLVIVGFLLVWTAASFLAVRYKHDALERIAGQSRKKWVLIFLCIAPWFAWKYLHDRVLNTIRARKERKEEIRTLEIQHKKVELFRSIFGCDPSVYYQKDAWKGEWVGITLTILAMRMSTAFKWQEKSRRGLDRSHTVEMDALVALSKAEFYRAYDSAAISGFSVKPSYEDYLREPLLAIK